MKNNTHILKKLIVGAISSLILCFGVFLQTPKVKATTNVISPITSLDDIPVGAVIHWNDTLYLTNNYTTLWKVNGVLTSSTGNNTVFATYPGGGSVTSIIFARTSVGSTQYVNLKYNSSSNNVYSSGVTIGWLNSNYKTLTVTAPLYFWYNTQQDNSNSDFIAWFNESATVTYEPQVPQTTLTFYDYTGQVYATRDVNKGQAVLMDFPHSEREGYTFRGWALTTGQTQPDIIYGTEWTPTLDAYNLYEIWLDNGQVVINFDANGGTGTPPQAVNVQKNSNYTLPNNPGLTKTNYDFDGWSRNANASSGSLPGSQIEVLDTGFTLYAIWVLQKKTLTLNLQGGNIPGGVTSYNIDYGTTYNLNQLNTPVKTGFVFLGWGLTSDATEFISQITMTNNQTIYAIWGTQTQDLATLTFNGNGATGGAVPGSVQVIKGQQYTLPQNPGELVKTGYSFVGWGTTSDATTAITEITPNANITLYAIWQELNYATINLQVNGQAVATCKLYNGALPTFYLRFNEFNNDYFWLKITGEGVTYSNIDYNWIWNIIYNSSEDYGKALYTFNGANIEKIVITTPNGTTEYDEAALDLEHYDLLYFYNNNAVYTINIVTDANTDFDTFNTFISNIFNGTQTLLNIRVGWFTIGSLVAVVLAIGVLFFVIRIGKGGSNG